MSIDVIASNVSVNISILNNTLGFKIYCLEPPDDSCEFGPCPNTDVTGFGQQVSLYISATVFIITLVHIPKQLRFAWYAYVVNVIAFLTSALISIGQKSITRDDAIFVIVSMASPASIYIWYLFPVSVFYLIRRKGMPTYLNNLGKYERLGFLLTSLVTFGGWAALFYMTFEPKMAERLSQKACNTDYAKDDTIGLLIWSAVFFVQCIVVFLVVFITLIFQRIFTRERANEVMMAGTPGTVTLSTWTFRTLRTLNKKMGFAFWSRPVLAAQLVPLCHTLLDFGEANPYSLQIFEVVFLIVFVLHLIYIMLRKWRWSWFAICMILAAGFLIAIPFVWRSITSSLSTILLPLLGFVVLTDAGQVSKDSSFLHKLKSYWPLSVIFFASLLASNNLWFPFIDQLEEGPTGIFLTVIIVAFVISFKYLAWVMMWQISSFRPSPRFKDDFRRLWHGIVDHSTVFKFVNFVFVPSYLWIYSARYSAQSSNVRDDVADPFAFGQVYSIITAGFAVCALLSDLIFGWKDVTRVLSRAFQDVVVDPEGDALKSPLDEKVGQDLDPKSMGTNEPESLSSVGEFAYGQRDVSR